MRRIPPTPNISIAGDEQEQFRIQLEKNLLHTDLSLHLSNDYSVEVPRHQSNTSALFSAFDRSRDADLDDVLSQVQAWSYHTGEDDEGVQPFVGETLSTAGHHASALTLSAGLAGRGERRDISLSGAEYDPERPLQDLLATVRTKVDPTDTAKEPSRPVSISVPFDPPIVDSVLSSSESDSPDPPSVKPGFSDALSHLISSPRRPRSSRHASQHPLPSRHIPAPPLRTSQVYAREGEPTPRPRKGVRLQAVNSDKVSGPPTPPSTNSNFTRLARGLAREIEAEESRWHTPLEVEEIHVGTKERRPTQIAREKRANTVNADVGPSNVKKKQVVLPDLTGLSVAVESPAKGVSHQPYGDTRKESGDDEGHARLQLAVNFLQTKIAHLDAENHTSRRRMKELERELDVCRQDVERQRDLVIRREEQLVKQRRAEETTARFQGKARAVEDTRDEQRHYKQAVEEKKALEALITTLRSHLARLTSELSRHKALLDKLQSLREADKNTLRQKVREVDLLRRQVEKLAGEVEVLKGVVEEGLRERRERSLSHSHDELQVHGPDVDQRGDNGDDETEMVQDEEDVLDPQPDADDYEIEDVQPALARPALLERTTRTGRGLFGSSSIPGNAGNIQRYVEDSELERISVELEERRSERSRSSSRLGSSVSSNGSYRAPSVVSSIRSARNPLNSTSLERAATPDKLHEKRRQASSSSAPLPTQAPRPAAPTPAHARERHHASDMPFPQIRGARLERMFFSAPEHNTKTCTVCNRRRYREAAPRPLWYPASKGHNVTVADANDEDEGFGEGSVIEDGEVRKTFQGAGVNLDFLKGDTGNGHLPPQTVLVRVLRELEDDFTHYKGIYTELADQYKIMDAASNVVRRNVLAQHLREVIDVLEQRGDQIASLYDLLTFEDKPVARSVVPEKDPGKQEPVGLERTRHSGSRKRRLAFA